MFPNKKQFTRVNHPYSITITMSTGCCAVADNDSCCEYTLVSRVRMASLKVSSDRPWGPARAKKGKREREETLINMQHLFTFTNFQHKLMESINNTH